MIILSSKKHSGDPESKHKFISMILDSLKDSTTYFNLNPRFRQAFDFIRENNLADMAAGKYTLDGENLFITIAEIDGKAAGEAKTEAHRKYIDIQIVLCGQEIMGWTAVEKCQHVSESYHAEQDIIFYEDKPTTYLTVNPGEFVVFFPEDGHAPAIGNGRIKKAVVKVLVQNTNMD
jgi:YhcH/YjgK/YiaL family protein